MKDYYDKNQHHSMIAIVIGFTGSALIFAISLIVQSDHVSLFLETTSVALYLFSCAMQGLRLTEQKKTMPAAGFTILAIAQGVIFTTYFEPEDIEGYTKGYALTTGSMLLFIPAMFLIAFYTEFPRWVNILGLVACIPLLIDFILFEQTKHYEPILDSVYLIAEILLELTALTWAYFIWKNYYKELGKG